MSTYGELLLEVTTRMNRGNDPTFPSLVDDFVRDRIFFYSQSEFFWPGAHVDTSLELRVGQAFYAFPVGTLEILDVRIYYGASWVRVTRVPYDRIIDWDITNPPTTSIPQYYSSLGNKLRLWPRPNQAYRAELTVEGAPLPPREMSDSNFWTNEAFTLIVESAASDIARSYLKDDATAARHDALAMRELKMLRTQTIKLGGSIRLAGYQ